MNRKTGIDIIIPVYNALEDLKLCIDSIQKHTDLTLDRLVLIDDRSPDPEVYPYLQSLEGPGITVLQNETNQGFSGTVNRGLQYSRRDALLLNSDTVVTAGWVDKLVRCAYSDPAIGTVTPFSNNATLCSVPEFCRDNPLPQGLSIDEYAAIIQRCSLRAYPRITVAVGFCMLIKREVVDAVGLFDQQTFQRGYGEENDFCWRAQQLGYCHVLCDDTFIYHSGSCSFLSQEKQALMDAHQAILLERYPLQFQRNSEYVRDNPHQYLRDHIGVHTQLHNGRRNILYVLHLDFRADSHNSIGGTQFHVKDLTMALREDHNVFVLARDGCDLRLTAYTDSREFTFCFPVGREPDFLPFRDSRVTEVFAGVLSSFGIDLVHIHHVHGLSLELFAAASAQEVPVVATLHDYYYICPTVKLLENGKTYCGGRGDDCAQCLKGQLGCAREVELLPAWQAQCRQALAQCRQLFAPSEAARQIYAQAYPELGERIGVIGHGMDILTQPPEAAQQADPRVKMGIESAFEKDNIITGWAICQGWDSRECRVLVRLEDRQGNCSTYGSLMESRGDVAKNQADDRYLYSGFRVQIPDRAFASQELTLQLILCRGRERVYGPVTTLRGYCRRELGRRRVAFLGGLNTAKGSALAYEMIRRSGDAYDWYIIGGLGDGDLITLEKKNVFKTNWYQRENVCAILQQNAIDLVCILPIWPETFCYTVSEAQLAGIPVLCADIGALGDRIRRDGTGWLVDSGADAGLVLDTLKEIFGNEAEYLRVKAHTQGFRHTSIAQMAQSYRQAYQAFPRRAREGSFLAREIYQAYAAGSGGDAGQGSLALRSRVNELEATLRQIQGSLEYRMVRFFNREKFPFKGAIKKLIGFAYRVYKKFFRK